jgi:hypothetical protein
MPPPRYAPDPPPPLAPIEWPTLAGWKWTPNAIEDMAALAWVPGGGDMPNRWEPEVDREAREDRRLVRQSCARKHLAAMREKPMGALFADVLWFAYGTRGSNLNNTDALASRVHDRFATADQKARQLAWVKRHAKTDTPEAFAVVGLGNAIIGCAVDAYNKDEWSDPCPHPPVPVVPEPPAKARAQYIQRMIAGLKNATTALDEFAERRAKRNKPSQNLTRTRQ